MERVVTINLAGNAYQLDESAYDALRAYMERAERALASNPDKAEVLRDLEQAIADKCAGTLTPHRTVVSLAAMQRALEQMGPVEGAADADAQATSEQAGAKAEESAAPPPRRLYRIYDKSAWTGVSAGLAAYSGIDVAWVRTLWIISALVTGGFTIVLYIVLIFAVPVASGPEEIAAAHGAPFTAQHVVERAKREYASFAESEGWKSWTRNPYRAWRESWPSQPPPAPAPAPAAPPAGYLMRMFAGLSAFVLSLVAAALLIAFLLTATSLVLTGDLFGWRLPDQVPWWLAIVIAAIVYGAIESPFRAMRNASYTTARGGCGKGADALTSLAIVAIALWSLWAYWPDARHLMESAYFTLTDAVTTWNANWN